MILIINGVSKSDVTSVITMSGVIVITLSIKKNRGGREQPSKRRSVAPAINHYNNYFHNHDPPSAKAASF